MKHSDTTCLKIRQYKIKEAENSDTNCLKII